MNDAETWMVMRDKIRAMIEETRTALERASGDNVPRLQGRIAAFRAVLDAAEKPRNAPSQHIGDDGPVFPS